MIGFNISSSPDALSAGLTDNPTDPAHDVADRTGFASSAVPHSGPRPAPPQ